MGKTFIISDTHFNNESIIKYCKRPFLSSDHQNYELIKRWNNVVSEEDTVICLGDFIMGAADGVKDILFKLNGHIILTRGNHDTGRKLEIYRQYPLKITVKDIHYETYGGLFFIFSHFPMVHQDFMRMIVEDNSEVVYCHGHIHDKGTHFNEEFHSFNCSADVIDFTPVPLSSMYRQVKDHFIALGVWKEKEKK